MRLFWVPAAIRGENDPAKQFDTSNGNRFIGNLLGIAPTARAQPNGIDFFWDEQGIGNCWAGNRGARRHGHERPGDAAGSARRARSSSSGNPTKTRRRGARARRGIRDDNPDPPGCTWFTTPPKPSQ